MDTVKNMIVVLTEDNLLFCIVVLTEDNLLFRTAFSDFEQQTFRINNSTVFLLFLFLSLPLLVCFLGVGGRVV